MMTQSKRLVEAVFLILLAGALLIAAAIILVRLIPASLISLAFVALGMLTMATLTAIERFAESSSHASKSHGYQLVFDEAVIGKIIEGFGEASKKSSSEQVKPPPPWELNAGQLVGVDDELALAKLRMDIEREVRLMAYNANIDLSNRPINVTSLTTELSTRNILPSNLGGAIKDVVAACNQGIHGQMISAEDATKIVRVGGQLLEELRFRAEAH